MWALSNGVIAGDLGWPLTPQNTQNCTFCVACHKFVVGERRVFRFRVQDNNSTQPFYGSGFCPRQPKWAGTRRDIHPLTPIVVINCPLSASDIYYDPWHPLCSFHAPDSLFPRSLSKFSLVYLLARHSSLHTPYIFSPNHCLLFATHAHTIATCFTVVSRLCYLILVSLSTHYLEFCLVVSHHTSI